MKNFDINRHEIQILEVLDSTLKQAKPLFQKAGLTYQISKLKISGREMSYSSEISIDFFEKEQIVDVIEFSIFINGNPQASIDETECWLKESINDVLMKNGVPPPREGAV